MYDRAAALPLFWPGSLGSRGFEAILEAAAAGDFRHLAVSPQMLSDLMAAGHSPEQITTQAAALGIELTHLDGVSSWAPIRYQDEMPPPLKARFDIDPERCLEMAAAVGMKSVLAAGAFAKDALALPVLIEAFGTFCDRAAAYSLRVELEFVPFWGIPDIASAWRIVKGAGRPDTGLLVDTWHLQKGSADFERDMAILASIPGEFLQDVQVADAGISPQADTLYVEGRFRRFPGDGELALDRIVQTIAGKGLLRWIGPEIFGAAVDTLTTVEAGRRAGDTLRMLIERSDS